ncbi:MAG: NAD(P)/FAD-dependent oxidoreductase [Mobilicoccus sp.]|nr:NAD(P)/FAD-dependent oxidoreductase [Mobilicoccus sp.]
MVIGAGHHGLVAAALLADAGWDVLVLEQRERVGGAVASVERDGVVHDLFSACYPLAHASPVLRSLDLDAHGLRWAWADTQLAHLGDPAAAHTPTIERRASDTATRLAEDHPADGRTWLRLVEQYESLKEPLLGALLTGRPGHAARMLARVGVAALPDAARFALLPTTRMGEELFRGNAGRQLLAGNALHADVPPTSPVSGAFGWLMSMLAQDTGFPAPVGGSGQLALALARRASAAGVRIETGVRARRIVVRDGTARGVEANGRRIAVRRAVIADTSAHGLYAGLLDAGDVPPGLRARLAGHVPDPAVVKLTYHLGAPMPWTAPGARGAGVIHLGHDVPGLVRWAADIDSGRCPQVPFALVGQMSSIDASRSPAGSETLWLYTRMPRGVTDEPTARALTDAAERLLEVYAPGWRDLVVDRFVQTPAGGCLPDGEVGEGAVGGGTSQLMQQAWWRPVAGLGGPHTPVRGLYLGSSAAHPGGGVHGAAGANAARAALAGARPFTPSVRPALLSRLYRHPDPSWVTRP